MKNTTSQSQKLFVSVLGGIILAILIRAAHILRGAFTPNRSTCGHELAVGFPESDKGNIFVDTSPDLTKVAEFYEQEIAGKNLTLAKYYDQKLKEEEHVLWQELTTATGLTYDEVIQEKEHLKQYHFNKLHKKRGRTPRGLSWDILDLAHEVIADFAVNDDVIEIKSGKETCVGAYKLILCEQQLRSMPYSGARSVLGHEMIHVQQDDDFMRDAMCELLYRKGINFKKFADDHPFYKHMRFEELRADILSSLKDISYAQGALESLSVLIQYGDRGYPSHPLTSDRIKAVQEVANLLVYEQNRCQQLV